MNPRTRRTRRHRRNVNRALYETRPLHRDLVAQPKGLALTEGNRLGVEKLVRIGIVTIERHSRRAGPRGIWVHLDQAVPTARGRRLLGAP